MPVPATTGQLRTNITDMEIGDYIAVRVTNTLNTGFKNQLGTWVNEVPLTGVAYGNGLDYFGYFIKVDKGLLIFDRVYCHTITWDSLNSFKLIQGLPTIVGGMSGIIRSLTGGVAYVDANGNSSTTDKGLGAYPTNNEWDRYIVNFPTDKIQSGKTLDDVFHYDVRTWTQDTISSTIVANTNRIMRGRPSELKYTSFYGSSTSNSVVGFRPVFEYKE